MSTNNNVITVTTTVNIPVEKAWKLWNTPEDIMKWSSASPDWHTTKASSDLKAGGKFSSRMEAKDGSFGFDFEGTFDVVTPNEFLEYTLVDGRKVKIKFTAQNNATNIEESFEAETENPIEMQQQGWQAIMDSFKNYAESVA